MKLSKFTPLVLVGALALSWQLSRFPISPAPPTATATPVVVRGDLPDTSLYHLAGAWQDQRGNSMQLSSLRGRPQVMALIYGGCKGACPRIIEEIKTVEQGVADKDCGFVLVTMDPEVDSPESLSRLAAELGLGERWRLLRGTPDQVRELAAVLNVKYRKISATDYAHSNTITVLDADGTVLHQKEELGGGTESSIKALKSALPDECCR